MLNTYITQVQRLLHDPNFQFFTQAELTDYINLGRNRVAQDTKCLRQLMLGYVLTPGQESYPIASLPASFAPYIVDLMGVTLYYGTVRQKLRYLPFTVFDANLRPWPNYQTLPTHFTRMGALTAYLGPTPDQAYVTDWEFAINPNPLVSDATPEQLPVPFTDVVRFWAAHEAKFKEQSYGEAEMYEKRYWKWIFMTGRAYMTRTIPDPYAAR